MAPRSSSAPGAAAPSLRLQAYENFRQQVLQANIRPGQFVSQRELMQLLDMPLGAVRELIPRLEAEGLLRTVPKRGLQIANVDVRLIKNAFGLRRVLERHAAEQFCATASDADLEAIEESHWALVRRAQRDGIDEQLLTDATTVDWGLHDLMIDALGNELISDAYRLNSLRVRLIRLEGSTLEADILLPVLCEHLWFIQALRARDARAVVERIDLHITSAQHRVLGLPRPVIPFRLEDYPERLRPTEGAQP